MTMYEYGCDGSTKEIKCNFCLLFQEIQLLSLQEKNTTILKSYFYIYINASSYESYHIYKFSESLRKFSRIVIC